MHVLASSIVLHVHQNRNIENKLSEGRYVILKEVFKPGWYLFRTRAIPKSPSLTVPDFVRKIFCK